MRRGTEQTNYFNIIMIVIFLSDVVKQYNRNIAVSIIHTGVKYIVKNLLVK